MTRGRDCLKIALKGGEGFEFSAITRVSCSELSKSSYSYLYSSWYWWSGLLRLNLLAPNGAADLLLLSFPVIAWNLYRNSGWVNNPDPEDQCGRARGLVQLEDQREGGSGRL